MRTLTPITSWWQEPKFARKRHLQGLFEPTTGEISVECEVTGTLPPQLDGTLVRNGPVPVYRPRHEYHFFEGDGMVHALRLHQGRAWYQNRFVRTAAYDAEAKAGRALWAGMLDAPFRHLLAPAGPGIKPGANVNVVWHAGKLLAIDEIGLPWELDFDTLETLGQHTFGGKWNYPFTAHPKFDTRSGEMIGFGYDLGHRPYLRYCVVDARGELVHQTPIDIPKPVLSHDLAITENHSVLLDLPLVYAGRARSFFKAPVLRWDPSNGARFGVLPRRGNAHQVRWFEVKPCGIWHVLCAWEEGETIVLHAVRVPQFDLALANVWANDGVEAGFLYRWRLNLKTGRVDEEVPVMGEHCEFPRINDLYMGRRLRYGYAVHGSGRYHVKCDLETQRHEVHRHGDGRVSWEGVFAPPADAEAEDHGWLLCYRHVSGREEGEVVVIDARRFSESPVARIKIPHRVRMGPHGVWVSRRERPWK